VTPRSSRKRKTANQDDEDINVLPHNLDAADLASFSASKSPVKEQDDRSASPEKPPKKRTRTRKQPAKTESLVDDVQEIVTTVTEAARPDASPSKKTKANDYGLTPGTSPYPAYARPTPEECQEVVRILSKTHGEVKAPKTVPAPSLTVSGCGEVPSVLDALIRTRLSAATTGLNSSRAFKGLVETFGILKTGVGKGSVDWDAVRRASQPEVFDAIKSGGLAHVKSKDIKAILDMVYEENQTRHKALTEGKPAPGVENEDTSQQQAEIARAEEGVLSLDHLHAMDSDTAFKELTKYPGIGPKTASCVLLFCLQRPSFAVDTHVFRMCRWLGWLPPAGWKPDGEDVEGAAVADTTQDVDVSPEAQSPAKSPAKKRKRNAVPPVTRNSAYAHCEVRIPDDLKYPLHQLLIRHGKTCPRCRASTGEGSESWKKGCPIEHLVQRDGARKGAVDGVKGRKKKRRVDHDDEEDEDEELSDLEDDED